MEEMIYAVPIESQFGTMTISGGKDFLSNLYFPGDFKLENQTLLIRESLSDFPMLSEAYLFLSDYFASKFRIWDGEYMPNGSDFQMKIWEQTRQIPSGTCRAYGELATSIGKPKAARAVGMTMAKNPLPIIIPCHRVIGSSGKLTGFGGGLELKRKLLLHEGYRITT